MIALVQAVIFTIIISAIAIEDYKSGCLQLSVSTSDYDIIFVNSVSYANSLRCRVHCNKLHSYFHPGSTSCSCLDIEYQTSDIAGSDISRCSKGKYVCSIQAYDQLYIITIVCIIVVILLLQDP